MFLLYHRLVFLVFLQNRNRSLQSISSKKKIVLFSKINVLYPKKVFPQLYKHKNNKKDFFVKKIRCTSCSNNNFDFSYFECNSKVKAPIIILHQCKSVAGETPTVQLVNYN